MALRLLLDTTRLTDVLAGDPKVDEILERAEGVWIPFVAIAEIRAGFLGGNRRARNEATLETILSFRGVQMLFADRETTEVYARLFVSMRRAGTPVGANDLWIASLAVQHGLALFTRDHSFDKIPQVQRIH